MHIIYPYNEILPNKKAHDAYLYQSCSYLAKETRQVSLLCGKGSLSKEMLDSYYHTEVHSNLFLLPLLLIRKNNFFNISYNRPFFFLCQKEIKRHAPDIVILSVLKQGAYHLKRKLPGIKYIYEVHELSYYSNERVSKKTLLEKELFEKVDLLIVTTEALKEILQKAPYNIKTKIVVIPLATHMKPLPPPTYSKESLDLFYVGALYKEQGIEFLLHALVKTANVKLTLIGGKEEEILHYKKISEKLELGKRVIFLGFQPPSQLQELVKEADAFIAPFSDQGRMAYVAHTKLHDYAAWQRPVVAPDLPVVREHFKKHEELLFIPGEQESLVAAITRVEKREFRIKIQEELSKTTNSFSWEKRIERILQSLL